MPGHEFVYLLLYVFIIFILVSLIHLVEMSPMEVANLLAQTCPISYI